MLLPALSKAREKARAIACTNLMKQRSLCIQLYIDDNEDYVPPSRMDAPYYPTSWFVACFEYDKGLFSKKEKDSGNSASTPICSSCAGENGLVVPSENNSNTTVNWNSVSYGGCGMNQYAGYLSSSTNTPQVTISKWKTPSSKISIGESYLDVLVAGWWPVFRHNGMGNFAYWDGHVESMRKQKLQLISFNYN